MGKIYVFDEGHNFICEAVNYELLGDSKLEFIRKGKLIQGELTKQLKKNTRALKARAKGLPSYGNIQIDLEEAIAEAEKKDKLNGTTNTYEENEVNRSQYLIEQQQEADERELIYRKSKELEGRLAKGEEIEELSWLLSYQQHHDYKAKESLRNLKNNNS